MIPKIIHITWKNDSIFEGKSFLVENGLKNLMKINPDWEIDFYNDQDIEDYLKNNLAENDYNLIKNTNIIEKCDLWRLMILYQEGGLYIDLDRFINIPLNSIITPETEWVLPTYYDHDFSHDFMLTAPNNPSFLTAMQLNVHRRRLGMNNIYFLGPQTYMHGITINIMGDMINSNPGIETMSEIRNRIKQFNFITTFREEPWKYHVLFNATPDFDGVDYELEKRRMYEEFDMHHWTETF